MISPASPLLLRSHVFVCVRKGPKRDFINWAIGNSLSQIHPPTQIHRQSVCSFETVLRKRLWFCYVSIQNNISRIELTFSEILKWTLRFNQKFIFEFWILIQHCGSYWTVKYWVLYRQSLLALTEKNNKAVSLVNILCRLLWAISFSSL